MTVTTLMVFILISQILLFGYLLYSFNDIEREARKRMADLRAHVDAVCNDLRETRETIARKPSVAGRLREENQNQEPVLSRAATERS